MIVLAWLIMIFTFLQFLVALANLLFLQRFPKTTKASNPLVSILIPARNEEKNIGNLLNALQNQPCKNIEMIIFNDQSVDNTASIIIGFAENDRRIKLIESSGLPEGWLGKNHACHSLAKHARGSFLLFLDADVSISGNIIQQTVAFAEKYQLGLLSIFPMQIMKTLGEKITVPNMNYILLSLLPLILVRKTQFPSVAAANGQFMLFHADTYHKFQPHEKMKNSKVEDIEIARWFKQNKIKVGCVAGNKLISCRMYNGFSEAIRGFSKNVTMFFGNSFALASLFWLITSFGFILIFAMFSTSVFLLYVLLIIITRVLISTASNQKIIGNLLLIIPQQITLVLFIYQAFINKIKKQHVWKGRNIS